MGALVRSERRNVQAVEDQSAVQARQYLTFTVIGEMFGVGIVSVKEIIEYRAPTEVPMMPPFMRGVINLRGRVVPVIDLAVRFGRTASEIARRTCIVIVEVSQDGATHDIGVMVDTVNAVLDIADDQIEPAPSFGTKIRAEFITGMGKVGERFVILLDIAKVLSVEELAALVGVTGAAEV